MERYEVVHEHARRWVRSAYLVMDEKRGGNNVGDGFIGIDRSRAHEEQRAPCITTAVQQKEADDDSSRRRRCAHTFYHLSDEWKRREERSSTICRHHPATSVYWYRLRTAVLLLACGT